ncbi:hypothetical protein [Streptomyces sp. MMBL 11-1]|uniref:hypothetical protein n=1 Tax=Streptomyces sp. MMBL 11-1 TaxID=3026420 RepID=UPI00235FC7B7|nr:hypothetical protein [Streptomyces sp. MMBL 11-1]
MAHLTYEGTIRTRLLNEVRGLPQFQVRRNGQQLEVLALFSDPETRIAWIECERGTWRLPAKLFPWAETVEDRAREITGRDEVFPCRTVWEQDEDSGELTVEIFPNGYRSPS